MEAVILELPDLDATAKLGSILGALAEPSEVITLAGDLGAGKTTLTQAIAKGLDIAPEIPVTSPTFSLLHEYDGSVPLYHMDLYRLSGREDIEFLGFEEYIYGEGLTVIEWPDRLGEAVPEDRLHVEISLGSGTARTIRMTPFGPHWEKKLPGLLIAFEGEKKTTP